MNWLDRYDPYRVAEALAPYVGDRRRQRIESILETRLVGVTVVLESLHDPHNGAAVIRSLEAFGVARLHVVETRERFRFSSAVTQGCEKWIELHRYPDFPACAQSLRQAGFHLYAAMPGEDAKLLHAPLSIDQLDVERATALVFGNEHDGVAPATVAACDGAFSIPMFGFTQSFNLSVSVALALYDTTRRRRAKTQRAGDLSDEERARLRAKWYAQSLDGRAAHKLVERFVSK